MRKCCFWSPACGFLLLFLGCTDGNVSASFSTTSTQVSPPKSIESPVSFDAPTLSLASGTSPANNSSPTITASGVSSGDQITIYRDSSCSTKVVSATATSSSVNLTISPSLSSEGTYTYYAKRVNGSQTSGCTSTALSYQYLQLAVSALYPNNGLNWNDYVQNDNGGDRFLATDTACSPMSTAIHSQCIHGGEKRVVTIFGSSSCSGLTMQDSLQAFDWQCVVINGVVKFISRGLRSNMGVADLLNTAIPSWKSNYVTLYVSGSPTAVGNSSIWYTNSVGYLTSGLTLSSASKVYTINANLNTTGHIVSASKVTIAIPRGLKLTYNGTSNNCNAQGAAGGTNTCLIGVTNNLNYTWIEGSFQGTDGTNTVQYGVLLYANSLTHIRNVFISNITFYGVKLNQSSSAFISGYRASQMASGIVSSTSNYNVIYDATISNTTDATKSAIYFTGGPSNNTVVRATLTANAGYGYYSNQSYYTTLSHVSTFGNALDGIYTTGIGYYNGFNQIASAGNSGYGFNFTNNCTFVMSNLYANQNSGAYSIYDSTCGYSKYTGALLVSSNTCQNNASNAGITNACVKTGSSTAVRANPVAPTFVGFPTKDGFNNNSNSTSFSSITTLLGWNYFENFYRTWISNSTSWLFTNTGACTSGTCNWWDFSLASGDTSTRSKFGTFTAGAACPSSVGTGADYNTLNWYYGSGSTTYFLSNAIEVLGSRYGNDNGVCEANEECIFTSNLGSYQGIYNPNATSQTCTYSNTTVANVTLYNAFEFTSFDSANSSSNVSLSIPNQAPTFSSSNLVLYNSTTTIGSAVGNLSFAKSSGKYYFEVYINSLNGTAAGVGVGTSSSVALIDQAIGTQSGSFGYLANGGLMAQGSSSGTTSTFATGDSIGVAVDAGSGSMWFSKNGVWLSGSPASGTSPTFSGLPSGLVPMGSLGCTSTSCQMNFNFGQSLFQYPVPSGFNPGWYN